jgi:hypothetical protein
MNQKQDGVYYFPSYELFEEVYSDPFQDDNRHPRDEYVANAMDVSTH